MDQDWAPQFHSLLSSPLGKELLRSLSEQADLNYRAAGKAEAGGQLPLLNRAEGIMLAKEHLQFRAILPKDEGSKASKIKSQKGDAPRLAPLTLGEN